MISRKNESKLLHNTWVSFEYNPIYFILWMGLLEFYRNKIKTKKNACCLFRSYLILSSRIKNSKVRKAMVLHLRAARLHQLNSNFKNYRAVAKQTKVEWGQKTSWI